MLDKESISRIIMGYSIPKDAAHKWAEYCGGSPRVAHVFGQNLKNNPDDLLRSPDTVEVWDRYIVGYDNPDTQEVQDRRRTLQYVALFKKFGFGRPVISEAQAISRLIEEAYTNITLFMA